MTLSYKDGESIFYCLFWKSTQCIFRLSKHIRDTWTPLHLSPQYSSGHKKQDGVGFYPDSQPVLLILPHVYLANAWGQLSWPLVSEVVQSCLWEMNRLQEVDWQLPKGFKLVLMVTDSHCNKLLTSHTCSILSWGVSHHLHGPNLNTVDGQMYVHPVLHCSKWLLQQVEPKW